MSAPERRGHAATVPSLVDIPRATLTRERELWRQAEAIRQEWLDVGLDTKPADRVLAEASLSDLYARVGRPRPTFVWVDSPRAALPLLAGLPDLAQLHQWVYGPRPPGRPPLASDLATLVSGLRGAWDEAVDTGHPDLRPARAEKRRKDEPWPDLPAAEAFAAGVPFGVVLRRGVRDALLRSLAQGCYLPIRAAAAREFGDGRPLPVCWYGQQDVSWLAYAQVLERLGFARVRAGLSIHYGQWQALARSCGWWWPGEEVCVVVERPVEVSVEPVPDAVHGEVRLRPDGVRFRDGWRPLR